MTELETILLDKLTEQTEQTELLAKQVQALAEQVKSLQNQLDAFTHKLEES